MSLEDTPLFRAFERGRERQALDRLNETDIQRQKREEHEKNRARIDRTVRELARRDKEKADAEFARRLEKKRRKGVLARAQISDFSFPESTEASGSLAQGSLRAGASGQVQVSTEEDSISVVATPSQNRPKKYKKFDDCTITKILEHYCSCLRNNKRTPIKSTLLFAEHSRPPVYITDSTLSSWISKRVDKEKCEIAITRPSATKAGRPSVLDEETLQKLEETITAVRLEIGARVNIPMAQGIIKRVLSDQGKGHLVGNGPGQIQVSRTWTNNFLTKRLKWRYRSVTSCTKLLPNDWEQQRDDFLLQLAYLIRHHRLTKEDVYNIDETSMLYNPAGRSKTFNPSGKIPDTDEYYKCEAFDHNNKDMITLTCAITASGDKLPLQYVFEGKQFKQKRDKITGNMMNCVDSFGNYIPQYGSCPKDCQPFGSSFVQTSNHWANSDTTFTFFDDIVMKHAEARSEPQKPILVIWDNAKFHCTDAFRKRIAAKYGKKVILCYLPTNTTCKLQPLDVSVNGAFKQAAKRRFFELAAEKSLEQLQKRNTAYHDLHKSASKKTSAILVTITQQAWDDVSSQAVTRGWVVSGLMEMFDDLLQEKASSLVLNRMLNMKCLNTVVGKGDSDLRLTLNVFDEDCLLEPFDESLCDNGDESDDSIDEEQVATILARIRTTKRTKGQGSPTLVSLSD